MGGITEMHLNSTDFFSKKIQNLYILISKIQVFKMLASDQSI